MDKNPPPIQGLDYKSLQANFSAILYLLSEQQALIGKLLQALINSELLTSHQLEKITNPYDTEEGLLPTYNLLYQRYAQYFAITKQLLDEDPDPDGTYRDGRPKKDD